MQEKILISRNGDGQKKDRAIDILKGIAIIAVIFGHITSPVGSFIFSWHMPLFFFISGFFIKTDESIKIFLIKNFKRILIYFFAFAVLGFLVTYFRNIFQGREHESILQGFTGIFYWMDMGHLNNYGFVLWFLPALFWGKFINFILLKYLKSRVIIGVIITSIFSLIVSTQIKLPFALDIGILASLWIYIGYIFYNYLRIPVLKYWHYVLIVAIPFLVYFFAVLQIPALNLSDRSFSSPVYNVIFSLFIIIPLYILVTKTSSKLTSKNKIASVLSYCGQNTMFLFVFHPYTNNIIYLVVNRFFNDIWYIKFILSFGLIYLALIITKKYLNKTILKYV